MAVGRISQIALRCAGIGFLAYLGFVIWPVRSALQEGRRTVQDAGDAVREVKPQIQPTQKAIGVILRNAAVITDETAKASTAQKAYWNTLSAKTSRFLDDTGATVTSIRSSADTLNSQLAEVGPLLRSGKTAVDNLSFTLTNRVDPLLVSGNTLVNSSNAFISDPNLQSTFANFASGSRSFALAADDGQRWFHTALYPDRKRVSGWRLLWQGVPLAGRVAEAVYYGRGALGR